MQRSRHASAFAARVPANDLVVALGHSFVDNGYFATGGNASFLARGVLDWARFLTKQRFTHNYTQQVGVSGALSGAIRSNQLAAAIATGAGTCVFVGETNDRSGADLPLQTSIDNVTVIKDAFTLAGRVFVLIIDPPRGNSSFTGVRLTASQIANHIAYRDWALAQHNPAEGVYVIDTWPITLDGASQIYDCVAALFADGLHPNQIGSFQWLAPGLVALFNAWFPARNILPTLATDAYNATTNPGGVMSLNWLTTGAGGTVTTPGAGTMTGTIADSHTATLTTGTGLTLVLSKVVEDGKDWINIDWSGTPTGNASLVVALPAVASGVAQPGDVMEGFAEWKVAAGQTGLNRVAVRVFDSQASVNRYDLDRVSAADAYPNTAVEGVARVPQWTVAAVGAMTPAFVVSWLAGVASSGSLKFRGLGLRRVVR